MDVRTLRPDEQEALLDLLDEWDVGDGWRGRDFFRRHLELDPTYRDENIWVAVDAGRPVSCVQIFPRNLRVGTSHVACGGIGSVFTSIGHRKRGLAESLLARATDAMRERGMAVSLLFAARIAWYSRLGWRSVGNERTVLERGAASATETDAAGTGPFDEERDLAQVLELHAAFYGDRPGTVVRDAGLWRAGLRIAGNPDEEFVVARGAGALRAYARAHVSNGLLIVNEYAYTPGHESALAGLLVGLAAPRNPDPLAERAGAADPRSRVVAPGLAHDPKLARALTGRGFRIVPFVDPGPMLRCLDAGALARAAGLREAPQETVLSRAFPGADFLFWPSDRF